MVASCSLLLATSCVQKPDTSALQTVGNPYLPLWEHIPDGEPYVFEDPDKPGHQRVYIYGSHDDLRDEYCGRDQVVWSAPVEDLSHWRYDGTILVVNKNARGEQLDSAGRGDVLYAPDVTMVTAADGTKTYYLYPNDQAAPKVRCSSTPLCLSTTTDVSMPTGDSPVPMPQSLIKPPWLPSNQAQRWSKT